ncbi:MAG: hypothetical protein WCK78_03580 [Paludibacter sp.]
MKTDEYINEFINREKQIEPNPYLATRVMAKIETTKQKKLGVFQYIAVAASISLVITMGVVIGNSYTPAHDNYARLNINDSEIENFALYNSDGNE